MCGKLNFRYPSRVSLFVCDPSQRLVEAFDNLLILFQYDRSRILAAPDKIISEEIKHVSVYPSIHQKSIESMNQFQLHFILAVILLKLAERNDLCDIVDSKLPQLVGPEVLCVFVIVLPPSFHILHDQTDVIALLVNRIGKLHSTVSAWHIRDFKRSDLQSVLQVLSEKILLLIESTIQCFFACL